ncbi:methyl-accepting chemotaxis protein [Paenibacillus qinlingensis]|uniref:Methyl-accepting chemotaxis protein n=1 Tax=Paenibacillus qinlingensis TaxID=1837343 RepID=A0ABU1P2Q4_9BACL|nr:methyl-accepting chemotaxis protein [Paenibacillus qinlingensis]MDR6554003.1 methyl-accepting chemotaxis protein [Paenibacillus qinlingensis]
MQDRTKQQLEILSSIQSHLAMIMFDTSGYVTWANSLFTSAMGYTVEEIIGFHHSKFCLPEFVSSSAYENLWEDLRNGKAFQNKIIRVANGGGKLTLEATYMPVFNEGRVDAIIKIATDVTKRETVLQQSTADLKAMVEKITVSTDEVLEASKVIVTHMSEMSRESSTVEKQVKSIQSVTTIVKEIASQSHLLGLNAALEAARAGEHGRGFEVVANEIRKMASSSKQSAQEISDQLIHISTSVSSMIQSIEDTTKQISANSNSIEQLKKSYDHIASTTEHLASSI